MPAIHPEKPQLHMRWPSASRRHCLPVHPPAGYSVRIYRAGDEQAYLFFVDKERKLGAFLALKGEVKEPLTVKLEPCGSVSGRVLDQDGEPVADKAVESYNPTK